MDFSIPNESEYFSTVVADWAREKLADDNAAWHHTHDLNKLGVFALLGDDAVDPENQYLNVALVLEQLAAAGMIGPIAETIWAGAHHTTVDLPADGWVGAALPVLRDGKSLVPYGTHTRWLIGPRTDTGPAELVSAADLEPAYVPMSTGAAWTDGPATTLEQADNRFAWLSYAALTLGYSQRLIDLALRQTEDRRAFGRPLLTFQAPRFALVECYQLVSVLRTTVRDAAWRADQNQPAATALAAAAWLLAADVGRRVTVNVHQVMGAASFPTETGVTPITGAMSLLRVGNGIDTAAHAVWDAWRTAAPERPSNIGGVFAKLPQTAPDEPVLI